MKKLLLLFVLFAGCTQLFAQGQTAPIESKKGFGTVIFSQNGQILPPAQLLNLMQSNPAAYQEMKKAKSNNDIGTVLGMAGGGLIGWPIGSAIGGGKPNWALAGIGAGLIAVAIPFSNAYSKRATNAVNLYNNGTQQTGMTEMQLKVGMTANGVGLNLKF